LRQIGIGLSHYATDHGHFPPAQGFGGYSFLTKVLPYIDQRPLYDALNFNLVARDFPDANSTVQAAGDRLFLCPSDPASRGRTDDEGGATNYAGSRGVGVQKFGENGLFAFPPLDTVALASVTDGLSETAAVSEWLVSGDDPMTPDPARAIFQTPQRLDGADQFNQFIELCKNLDPIMTKVIGRQKGINWTHGEFGFTLYNHTLPPNGHTCLNGSGYQIGAWTAGSLHPGGAHSLAADGSVRFVRQSVRLPVWHAFGSRNGNEAVSADDL
jgi:hypothetical protein